MPTTKPKKRRAPRVIPASTSLVERTVENLRKHFKTDDVALLMKDGGYQKVRHVAPTGIEVVDRWVIGIGGLPYGRAVCLIGDEAAGKTTLLCRFMGAAQQDGALVAFRDSEHKFDPAWGQLHGVRPDDLLLLQGETLEDFHDQALYLLKTVPKTTPLVIALDSIANLVTKRELEEGKDIPAEHAALWTKFLRPATELAARRGALLLFVNQMRTKVGVMYGNPETTFAGKALRYAMSLVLRVGHGKSIKAGEDKVARYMHVSAEKNQLGPPFRHAVLRLDYGTGFDDAWATVNHAKEMGCVAVGADLTPKTLAEALKNLGWDGVAPASSSAQEPTK